MSPRRAPVPTARGNGCVVKRIANWFPTEEQVDRFSSFWIWFCLVAFVLSLIW